MAHPPPPPRTTGMSSYANGYYLNLVKDNARRLNLKGAELQVMEQIALHANPEGISHPSMKYMEERQNCCKRTIVRAVAKLERRGLILKLARGRGSRSYNRYQIVERMFDSKHTSSGSEKVTLTPEKVTLTPEKVTSCSPEYSKEDTLNNSPIVPKGDKNQENGNSDSNHPALARILKLFQIPENQPLDTAIRRAWEKHKQAVENLSEEDWELLEWAHTQTQGEAYNFRRKSPSKLIRNLCAEITRSRSWKDRIKVENSPSRPAPAGWDEMIFAEYPDARLTTWEELPDSMKSWVREKVRERHEAPPATAAADSAMA
jgi:DNA-binding transcriptional regulator YhcF (GntR family)